MVMQMQVIGDYGAGAEQEQLTECAGLSTKGNSLHNRCMQAYLCHPYGFTCYQESMFTCSQHTTYEQRNTATLAVPVSQCVVCCTMHLVTQVFYLLGAKCVGG